MVVFLDFMAFLFYGLVRKILVYYIVIVALIVPAFWRIDGFVVLPIFQYLDEVLGLFAIIYIFFAREELSTREKIILILCTILVIVGGIGTYKYHYQTSSFPLIMDAFQCVKCFLVFIFGNHYVFNMPDGEKREIVRTVNKFLAPFLVMAFVFAIVNLFVDIGMHNTYRNGFRAFQFVFRKSGTFSDLFFVYLIFLTIGYQLSKHKNKYLRILFMSIVTWILTMRTRSIVYAPLFVVMFYWMVVKQRNLKLSFSSLFVIGLIVITLGLDKVETTYGEEDAGPRAILLSYGIKTMMDHVPIGAGLATYGTDMATKYYSPLYYEYGFDMIWGMDPDNPMFTHDNYWPSIMGEFGIIGTIIVVLILLFMGFEIFSKYKHVLIGEMMALFIYITLVLTSSAAPAFFSNYTAYLFMLFPLVNMHYNQNKINKIDNE